MVQTALFKEILKKSYEVKDEFHAEHLTASHIAVAVADFCAIQYTGLTPIQLQSAARFEEERLRYLFSKEIKIASYLRKNYPIIQKTVCRKKHLILQAATASLLCGKTTC